MIPKKSKYALTVTLLALSTACLATGCKKKHDKIDLSGSQAAESTVQTAPVSTTAAESESSSSITIEPGIENAQSQGTSAGGAATSLSLSVKTDTYQNGNVSIQYPVISDNSVKPEINDHLKDNRRSQRHPEYYLQRPLRHKKPYHGPLRWQCYDGRRHTPNCYLLHKHDKLKLRL